MGRKIERKCIGTTLLTKGLEFDTVVLIEADKNYVIERFLRRYFPIM